MLQKFQMPGGVSASRRKVWIPRALGALVVLGALLAFGAKPAAVEQIGNLIFDRYQTWKPREYQPDVPVRVVDIDNESIARIGQWPWSRLTLARLNDRLNQAGAGVIAYDVIFSEADRTSPANLAEILRANPAGGFDASALDGLADHDAVFAESLSESNSVLGFFLINAESEARPATRHSFATANAQGGAPPTSRLMRFPGSLPALSALGEAAAGEGSVSLQPDGDGIARAAPLFQRLREQVVPSLSAEALRVVQGAQTFILRGADGAGELGGASGQMASAKVGDFEMPTDGAGRFRVYYTEASRELTDARTIPAWRVLESDDWIDRVAGNIVFVGTSADGLKDLVATPMAAQYEGVAVHAQIAEQVIGEAIYGGQILRRPYWAASIEMWLILIPGLLMVWLQPRLGAGWSALLMLGVIAGVIAYSWTQFASRQVLINPVYPVLGLGLTYLLMTVTSFALTEAERSRIRGAFSRYLSPDMVERVSDNPGLLTLGGEERPMTVLFLDIRSFSRISEAMDPQDIVTFLNLFLTPMTDTLQDHRATIDKYIGDAIVAFWNAPLSDPDHARNACRAVLAMSETLLMLRDRYADQTAINWPDDLAMGIGLNTGVCCVGNLGSEQRFSYSMIGDAANLASRIEGLTKFYRVETLIGDATAREASDFALLEADRIRVVGRDTPERVHILIGTPERAGTSGFKALKTAHDAMIKAYRAQDWDAADAHAAQAKALAEGARFAGYYDVMAARISAYRAQPPEPDWDGVFVAESK